jgi:cell division protein FtsL
MMLRFTRRPDRTAAPAAGTESARRTNRVLSEEERTARVRAHHAGPDLPPDPQPDVPPAGPPPARKSARTSPAGAMRRVLSGDFLAGDSVVAHIPYILFVSALFIAYIALGYHFERTEREKQATRRQLDELSAEYKTLRAEYETLLQQSTLEERVAASGLAMPTTPPILLEQR